MTPHPSHPHRGRTLRSHGLRRPLVAAFSAVLVLAAGLVVLVGSATLLPARPAAATPGSPGTPGAPSVLYHEDFENGTDAAAVGLTSYTGAGGQTYNADPYWVGYANCNGVILRYGAPTFGAGQCSNDTQALARSRNNVRRLADVLGQVGAGAAGGTVAAPTNASNAASQANHAVTAWTAEQSGGNDLTQFESSDLDLVASSSRYYSMSVDVAEASCLYANGVNNSLLDFSFLVGATELPVNAAPIRACTDPATGEYTSPALAGGWYNGGNSIRAGRFYSDGGVFLTPAQIADLRIVMRNETGQQAGNDSAFDNITLLDTTPQLDKSFEPALTHVGQTSTLTFTVTNRADLGSKYDWGFTDALPAGLVVSPSPNVGGTCTQLGGAPFVRTAAAGGGTIAVSGGDLGTGDASCTITVDVTAAHSGTYTNGAANMDQLVGLDPPGDAQVRFIDPALSLTKTPDVASYDAVGDTITYTFVATNSGEDPLHDVTITDPLAGLSGLSCAPAQPAVLAPGASMTCTATYPVDQADLDAGSVQNTATTTGTDELGLVVTDTASATVVADDAAAIQLTKDPDRSFYSAADQTITYTLVGTNVGNSTLHGVTVSDPLDGLSTLACTPAAPAVLAPGAHIECTASYSTTQADVDAGAVENTATAVGTDPSGDPVSDDDTAVVPGQQTPGITLVKSADRTRFDAAGQTVTYSFTATNSGNTTLSDVSVSDPLNGLSPLACTPSAPAVLAPGGEMTCTATYVTTQADVDAGRVQNTATATGTDPGGDPVSDDDTVTVPGDQSPAISLVKSANRASFDAAGQAIAYSFTATNTGNTTLSDVVITDPLDGLSDLDCTPAAPAVLAAGAEMTCTATYATTQADVDAGRVANTATAAGTDPGGHGVSDEDTVTVPGEQSPAISLVKAADRTRFDAAGQTVTYSFTVTNTGNTTLSDVSISDPLNGLSDLACDPVAPAELAPGDEMTCTATYVTTQADADAGVVANTATATGTDPGGDPVSDDDTVKVPGGESPAISLVKSADRSSFDAAGQTITYTFTATNTGGVTLTDVAIADPLDGLSDLDCDPAAPAKLAPGAAMSCTATYETTQADLDEGVVENTATATGADPGGDPVSDDDTVDVPGEQSPAISLVKSADRTLFDAAGQTITYTFTATNIGNTTLTDVAITDPLDGLSALDCDPAAPAELGPGDDMTCTATYQTTRGDVKAGHVRNTATATGTDPGGDPVSDDDTVEVPAQQRAPGISLVKSADRSSFDAAGQTITYTFTATNIGNTMLTDVDIADPLDGLSALTCDPSAPAELAPGDEMTCTATYETTQADVDAGGVENTATATGTDPGGDPVSDDDTVDVPGEQSPAISLVKSADRTLFDAAGQTITYTFTATNIGNTTLTDVAITDPLDGLSALDCDPAAPAELGPGDAMTCTATYVTTAADVRVGNVRNTATATGTDPGGDPVHDDDTVIVDQRTTHSETVDSIPPANPRSDAPSGSRSTATATGWLPRTGADLASWAALGATLVIAGVACLGCLRRRRPP